MELRDLIVTPILLMLIYSAAYIIRPYVTDQITRRYFFPALTVRIIGALAVGFVYQFYYSGGDTFNYHTHGSRHLWEAFWDSPEKAFKIFWYAGDDMVGIYEYSSKIVFLTDPGSFAVVRMSFLFDLLTFSSYSATAIMFALVSFVGMWLFFLTFYEQYPHLHRPIAYASFFIPSVFFWGSGLLKDTLTLACVGGGIYFTHKLFVKHEFSLKSCIFLIVSIYGLYAIKIYILLVFLPTTILWVFLHHHRRITSTIARGLLFPVVTAIAVALGYYSVVKAGESNEKYSLSKIGKTAQITAYDIRYWTGKDAGSGYSLGDLDGSLHSMARLAPQAINVSLFRPYLWEVRNPLMLLSAFESFIFLVLLLYLIFFRLRLRSLKSLFNTNVLFLLLFSITFAFSVGVSTFNFGTLVRYKIPMMPAFAVLLILLFHYSKRAIKLPLLEVTE